MTAHNMPEAEVEITADLVRALLREQHPALAKLPCTEVGFGWDCVIYRLGTDRCVRMPRREVVARYIVNEFAYLPKLAPALPLAVPAAEFVGEPGPGYPWAWAVCPWIRGDIAAATPPSDGIGTARTLGAFLAALHLPAAPGAIVNPFRGQPIAEYAQRLEERVEQLGATIDQGAVRARWANAVTAPALTGSAVWIHGDLHPANLLVHNGALSGVIDFVDLGPGDRATDLAVAWMLFDSDARAQFRAAARGIDDATWARAYAWALYFAVTYLANSADNPTIAGIGRATLANLLADPEF